MKDFYDCYMLGKLYIDEIDREDLIKAIKNTARTRKTEFIFDNIQKTINLIENDESLKFLWTAYSSQFDYAKKIKFESLIEEIKKLLKIIELI